MGCLFKARVFGRGLGLCLQAIADEQKAAGVPPLASSQPTSADRSQTQHDATPSPSDPASQHPSSGQTPTGQSQGPNSGGSDQIRSERHFSLLAATQAANRAVENSHPGVEAGPGAGSGTRISTPPPADAEHDVTFDGDGGEAYVDREIVATQAAALSQVLLPQRLLFQRPSGNILWTHSSACALLCGWAHGLRHLHGC